MCAAQLRAYRYLMPLWRWRDYNADLDQAIQVWDQHRTPGSPEPVFTVAEVMAAARAGPPAVVAKVALGSGTAVARTEGEPAQNRSSQGESPGSNCLRVNLATPRNGRVASQNSQSRVRQYSARTASMVSASAGPLSSR